MVHLSDSTSHPDAFVYQPMDDWQVFPPFAFLVVEDQVGRDPLNKKVEPNVWAVVNVTHAAIRNDDRGLHCRTQANK